MKTILFAKLANSTLFIDLVYPNESGSLISNNDVSNTVLQFPEKGTRPIWTIYTYKHESEKIGNVCP